MFIPSNSLFWISAILIGSSLFVSAQSVTEYLPPNYQPEDTLWLQRELQQRRKLAIAQYTGQFGDLAEVVFSRRHREILESIEAGEVIFHPPLQDFVDRIFQDIITTNELILKPLILIKRSPQPNAGSLGHGLFVLNIGLFEQLGTVDELAYVFCHELAHDQMNHVARALENEARIVEQATTLSYKKRRKNRRKSGDELQAGREALRTLAYNMGQKSRQDELSADSLALLFLKKTRFKPASAQQVLHQLHTLELFDLSEIRIEQILQLSEFPLKPEWLAKEKRMFGGSFGSNESAVEKWFDLDSLNTHPALEERMLMLTQQDNRDIPEGARLGGWTDQHWQTWAGYEIIEYYFQAGLTAHALITSLRMLIHDEHNPYLHAMIARSFLMTYDAVEAYNFDRAVPPPNYFQDAQAQQLVGMLRKMTAKDLVTYGYHYLKTKKALYPENAILEQYLIEAKKLMEKLNK